MIAIATYNARILLFGTDRRRWGSGSRRDGAPLGNLLEVGACLRGSVAAGRGERCLPLGRCAVLCRHRGPSPHGVLGDGMVHWLLRNIAGTGRLRRVAPVIWIRRAGHGQPFWWCCLHMLNGMPLGRRAQTVTEALPYPQYAFAVIERKSHAPIGQVPMQQPHAVQSDASTSGKPVASLKERAPVGHAPMQAWHPLHCCASVTEV